jgi:hypothetical protein
MRHATMLALAAGLAAATGAADAASLSFTTIDNPGDPTFNRSLGINNGGVISGTFGSGQVGLPNQSYTIAPPYTTFVPANAPGAVQTQATGINAAGNITGFWSDTNTGSDANFGFIRWNLHGHAIYIDVNDPLVASIPPVTQMLGLNKSGIAAGFYNDGNGNPQGFAYNASTGDYMPVKVTEAVADAATGINNNNLICGFYRDASGVTHGVTKPLSGGRAVGFAVPGSPVTQLLGVISQGVSVGFYIGTDTLTHGLLYNRANGNWQTIDDPNGTNGTVLNGVNDRGEYVGSYTDAAGNLHGMLVLGGTMP